MRGDGVVEDVDGDFPPQDGIVVGDDDDDDFPLLEGKIDTSPTYLLFQTLLTLFWTLTSMI